VRLDGYIRVSRVGGRAGPSFISPRLQREQIAAWARFKEVEIAEFHTDLDKSGARMDRPGLLAAIARAESGESDGIVVAKLDRLGRSLTGALEVIKALDDCGAAFISVAEGLDPTTAAGKMMMRMMLVLAEFELDRVRESWAESRRLAVARGVHLASKTPSGYRRGEEGRLVFDPEVAPYLAEAFRMRAACRSWLEIRDYLEANGVKRFHGGRKWTSNAFTHLLDNRAYLGEARSGDEVKPDAHPALIDRGTWEGVQITRTLTTIRAKHPAPLGGLLRCAGCRNLMTAYSKLNRAGEARCQYHCKRGRADGGCEAPAAIPGWELEPHVEARFFELYESSTSIGRDCPADRERAESDFLAADAGLLELERQGSEAQLGFARDALAAARVRLVWLTRAARLPAVAVLRSAWPQMSVIERRRHLALLIDAVIVRGDRSQDLADRVLVVPFGAAEGIPRYGRAATVSPYRWPEGRLADAA
jgi:DNA invertase Pin-like site-specific DNA recombinase